MAATNVLFPKDTMLLTRRSLLNRESEIFWHKAPEYGAIAQKNSRCRVHFDIGNSCSEIHNNFTTGPGA
jgi:hypothetical protein